MKIFTVPQHTRFILPPIHPDKIIAALRGRYFSFLGTCQGKVPPSCCARPFRCLKNHWGFHCYATLANANRTLKIL